MSTKRQATSELNHENWDQDDPSEHEEMGTFKTSAKDVFEQRVIKTAKRRIVGSNNDEPKKSIFSGFGGINKTQPASFDFLSNLTKGTKTNGSPSSETDSNIINLSKPTSTTGMPQSGLFSTSATFPSSNNLAPNTPKSSLFSSSGITAPSSVFTMKASSTPNESPLKLKTNNNDTNKTNNLPGPSTFGTPTRQGLFSSSNTMATPPPAHVQPNTDSLRTNANLNASSIPKVAGIEISDYQLKYYSKLKALNESVSEWISKHVDATPLCILSPIFRDYESHLKEIQGQYAKDKQLAKDAEHKSEQVAKNSSPSAETQPFANKTTTFYNSNISPATTQQDTVPKNNNAGFTFGIKSSPSTTQGLSATPGFTFGATASPPTKSPFTLDSDSKLNTSGTSAVPFTFGIGKPFSYFANDTKPEETSEEKDQDADDEPPKVEYTPVVEESSVYDKKCKIFVKKDGNFIDKGVGTLYIKKIEDSEKYQLLMRANTNLGNVLLNFILSSSIPAQRMGKNNVMMVCIPTPDAKPPPTPILIRVKTSEEADELLETLNKYKA